MAGEQDDDPQLKSLRQVWLSMRDEDPPERGLDALMAAARSQAQILAQPTLWQRFVTAMRRPPVLALATVMVLLGGVLILTRHGDELEKAPTAPTPKANVTAPTEREGGAIHTETPVVIPPVVDRPQLDKAVQFKPSHHPEPTRGRPANNNPQPTNADGFIGEKHEDPPPPTRPMGSADKADAKLSKESAETAPKQPNEMLVDQLAAQARSAMTRGDCETAKTIGARIARQDEGYYRDHVANELAKCVAPATLDAAH